MGSGRREATWAGVREAYLAGAGAGEVCERFGVGLTALRDRAKREGWRRRDQADPAPGPLSELDAAEAEVDPDDLDPAALAEVVMMERAWRMAARALGRGRLREAQGWTRLVTDLRSAGETRRAAAIQAADQSPNYQKKLDTSLALVDRARRASAPPPRADSPDSADSYGQPDSEVWRRGPDSADSPDSRAQPDSDPGGEPDRVLGAASSPCRPVLQESSASPTALLEPLLNRAERRRRARLAAKHSRDGP